MFHVRGNALTFSMGLDGAVVKPQPGPGDPFKRGNAWYPPGDVGNAWYLPDDFYLLVSRLLLCGDLFRGVSVVAAARSHARAWPHPCRL